MKKYKTVEGWIREALADNDKEKPCSAISLIYRKTEGGTREIHTVSLKGKTWQADNLADLFRGKAESFAQDFGGIQKFELLAFYEGKDPEAAHPFTVIDGEIQSAIPSRAVKENPDGPGIIAQAMRHAEKAYELCTSLVQQIAVTSVERDKRAVEREEKLQAEVNDSYAIVREMLMDKVKLDHESALKQLEYARMTGERQKLMTLAPALMNTLSGKEIFPQAAADTALLEALADKVSPDSLQQLVSLGVIPNEIAGPLMARFNQILERKKKEATEVKRLPPSAADPRTDAAGGPIQ